MNTPATRWRALAGAGTFVILLAILTRGLLTPIPAGASQVVGGPDATFWISKVTHVVAYALLAWIATRLPFASRLRIALLVLLIVHGCATEYLQQFVGRGSSIRDVGLDILGVVLGFSAGWRRCCTRAGGNFDSPRESPKVKLQPDSRNDHGDADDLRKR